MSSRVMVAGAIAAAAIGATAPGFAPPANAGTVRPPVSAPKVTAPTPPRVSGAMAVRPSGPTKGPKPFVLQNSLTANALASHVPGVAASTSRGSLNGAVVGIEF